MTNKGAGRMSLVAPVEGRSPVDMVPITTAEEFSAAFAGRHRAAVRLAYLLCGDLQWAEDAAAEAFAATYLQWKRGRVDDVGAYARQAVVNQVRGGIRRRIVQRRHQAELRGPALSGSFEQQAVDRAALCAALLRLPARQRAAVVLRYYADLTENQAATALGCSLPALKSLTLRGLERLRQVLDDGGDN
jgi:RNA polymerase sigma-70 factor (sigma-E family)